jgi:6-phosphogluconolactonase
MGAGFQDSMAAMETRRIFISSCAPDGGILRFDLLQDGSMAPRGAFRADRPMFTVRRGAVLYALLQAPVAGSAESAALALRIDAEGGLAPLGPMRMLGGVDACHLALSPSGRHLCTANYGDGSLTQLPIAPGGELGAPDRHVRHHGNGPNPERQAGPHAHCTAYTPDGRYLCVVDLGLDRIFLYEVDEAAGICPEPFSTCLMEAGIGPRHLAFSKDGTLAYCVNELQSGVTVLRYADGRLTPVAAYSTLPASFTGASYCSAVRVSPCGRRVYAANRGHQSIACFAVDGEALRTIGIVDCGGDWPRDFDLSPDGSLLLCCNERSNEAVSFHVDRGTGAIAPTGFRQPIPAAFCLTF